MKRALWAIGALAALALLADVIASDLPILARLDGHLYTFPCIYHPNALDGEDNQSLRARAEWLIAPPIPYGPEAQHPGGVTAVLEPPSARHWLGTDDRGRDVAARLVHGARVALLLGPLAIAACLLIGVAIGVSCAFGRRIDFLLGRAIEVGLTFPTLFLLLAIQGLRGGTSLVEVGLAIALTQWPEIARLTRAEALRQAASPHVEAARALGASRLRIALRHVLPLAIAPALVAGAFGVAQAVLLESALTFLGFGAPPPTASWGELLAQAQNADYRAWLLLPPAVAIAVTVASFNLLADALSSSSSRSSSSSASASSSALRT
jgi:peptide/nickel transport system permease protein